MKAIRYEIVGTWTGYGSEQQRVCHREYSIDKAYAEQVTKVRSILFTDNTRLILSVREMEMGERKLEPINGYSELIRRCIREGKDKVSDLK
jgi:hypothetical protein